MPDPPDVYELKTGKQRYESTPKPPPVMPSPPVGLSTPARREWRRLLKELEPTGLLSRLDRDVLTRYSENLVIRARLHRQLEEEGLTVEGYRGSIIKHPAWQLYRDVTALLGKDGDRLGLSPTARLRMHIAPHVDEDDPILAPLTKPRE